MGWSLSLRISLDIEWDDGFELNELNGEMVNQRRGAGLIVLLPIYVGASWSLSPRSPLGIVHKYDCRSGRLAEKKLHIST